MNKEELVKAAERGVPSFVWRAGQERRLEMIFMAAGERKEGCVLVDGSGVGTYLSRLGVSSRQAVGLEIELERCRQARQGAGQVVNGAGEFLPFPVDTFDLVVSNEMLEHVQDERAVLCEIIVALKPGGRLALFCPNRGYPFETHGIYWRGRYKFGNIPLVNYLPRRWRDRLAPHVRAYTCAELEQLFDGLPVCFVSRTIIFGGYDNFIARFGIAGRILRSVLQFLEHTPLRIFGLSHFWVVEKKEQGSAG